MIMSMIANPSGKNVYLRKRLTALLMHAYTSDGRAPECQQILWGQAYVRNSSPYILIPSGGSAIQCGDKAHGFCEWTGFASN